MISTARASFRLFLILALLASCAFTLRLQAQSPSDPCRIGDAAPVASFMAAGFQAKSPAQPVAAILCGAAGQTCCVGGTCNSGLACNSNDVCRACGGDGNICCTTKPKCATGLTCTNGRCAAPPPPPCGGVNQACCPGNACNTIGLACNLAIQQCQPCGYYGTYCCPYMPTCLEGSCQVPGVCQP